MSNSKGVALILLAGAAAGGFYLWSARDDRERADNLRAYRAQQQQQEQQHWALQSGGNGGAATSFAPIFDWGLGQIMNSSNNNGRGGGLGGLLGRVFGRGGGNGASGGGKGGSGGSGQSGVNPVSGGGGGRGAWPDGLPASLIRTESSGDWTASNNIAGSGGNGHFGRGQFSRGRLQDAMNAGVIPQGMTPQQFMRDPNAQQAVERWHVGDIRNFISRNGLDSYLGQTIRGVVVTENGMIAAAHLGGNGGLRRFLRSSGSSNPADAYGTSLLSYMRTHGGQ